MFDLIFLRFKRAFLLTVFLFGAGTVSGQILEESPVEMEGIDIVEHLGDTAPLDLVFANEQGDSVQLGSYFRQGKPVLLSLVYYECPMLCTFVLNGLVDGVKQLEWQPGEEYQMVSVSIDPRETPELAGQKKHRYLKSLGKENMAEDGWAFLVGDDSQIRQLADALGFQYKYIEERDEYAHPAAVFLLTDSGAISRYLYGIEYKVNDLKLGLLEASEGKIGTTLDRLILYCFHYDPSAKSYVVFAKNVMKVGGAITLIVLVLFLAVLWARERLKRA